MPHKRTQTLTRLETWHHRFNPWTWMYHIRTMMTSTNEVPSDPPVSMPSDDDQAKAGSNTTHTMEFDTDPGTSPSRPELVKLQLDRDSSSKELRKALRPIVICLKPELKRRKKVRGVWQEPPEGWPEDEPFRDPNNKKKPRKDELFAMYKTAVRLYKQKYPEGIPTMGGMPLTSEISQPQPLETGSSTYDHPETASGGDAVNKRQQQGTQPEESNMSTLCQPTLWELRIKPLGLGTMMTSTSELPSDPPVSMPSDDDQAKVGSNTTHPMECDTDPGTSPSRPELEFLHHNSSSPVPKLREDCVDLVTSLKFDRNTPHENRKNGKKPRLWQKPPKGWPEGEPFRSPNNKQGDNEKPGKDDLLAMYKTLKSLYNEKYPDDIPTIPYQGGMPLTSEISQPQLSETGSSTYDHLETASGFDDVNKSQRSPHASRNMNDRRDSDTEVTGNQGVIAGGTYPMVVKDVPRPKLQVGMDPFTSSVSETRMDEALDKYGQACDGVSPTLVSFQSQPPEAGHWDSAQSKTAAGGSDVTSLRQGKQPEASSMSACSELRKKRLGTGLPADCSANDRQHSNAEVNENQGVPMVVKEGPGPGPGPQLQGVESEVTEDQVLEEAHLIAELNPAWMGLSASDLIDQLKLLDDGGAVMLSHDASQAGHAPVKSTGLSTGKDAMFSGQLQTYIPADNPLMDSFSNNNVSSPEEPQHLHVQNEPRKRKQTAVVESDSGQALPKRPRRRISESVTNIIQVPSATETQMGLPTTELTCNVCGNVMSECPDRFTHFEATLDV